MIEGRDEEDRRKAICNAETKALVRQRCLALINGEIEVAGLYAHYHMTVAMVDALLDGRSNAQAGEDLKVAAEQIRKVRELHGRKADLYCSAETQKTFERGG